jgi:subtilisin-like proprotein convertase family protein
MRLRTVPPRRMPFVTLLIVTASLPSAAFAKAPPAGRPVTIDARRAEATVARGFERIGVTSGVPRALYHVDYTVDPDLPEAMARQYLREHRGRLRLADPLLGDLVHRATRRGIAGTTVRFEQRFHGIPVLAPDVAVTIDRARRVTFVTNGYEPGVSVPSITPAVTAVTARGSALSWLSVEGPLAHEAIRLVVVPESKQARLAWHVQLVPSVSPTGDWEVLVDAETGEVFGVIDRALYVNGSGYVFDPDPLGTGHATYGSPGYSDGADATTAELDAARATRTLLDLTDTGGGTIKLQGTYAEIVDTESPFKGLFTQVGTTFEFDRAQDAFEAVTTYFHIDQIMRHVNLTLGVPVTPYQYATGRVRFDPSGLNGTDNSHYVPSTGQLAFGEGGVDDAEDADVVIHELGHGLHDWLTAGGLSQVNGLSEGLGDYVAQSYSRSLGQWASNEAPYHWVFSWDGHNEFWPGRTTNYGALYPGGLVNQIHTDGQIWSSCLMKIWDDIGRNKTDAAVFEGIAMTNASSSQDDAAQAVLQAAIALGYTQGEISSFVTHFQSTGYDVSAGIDYVSSAITDGCASDASNENGVVEPGEVVDVAVTIETAALPRTGVTGVLASTTPGVTIVDGAATWPDLAVGVPAASDAPHFRIAVDGSVACFSTIDLQLSVSSNEGGPFPLTFSLPVGQRPTPGGLPAAIPDNVVAGVTSTLDVEDDVTLTDVNVRVELAHTWVGDLHIKLRSPLGTEVILLDRPRYPTTPFGCGDDDMNVTFDDAATLVPETHCLGTSPWYTGSARAVQLLTAFNGQSSLGSWVLTVSDRAGQDVGTVLDWELITTPALATVCDPCQSLTGIPIPGPGERTVELAPNRPNPFSRLTEIAFQLTRPGRASLRVYDVAGQVVATLLDRELSAGPHVATWDGRDRSGNPVASGLYFYRLTSAEGQGVRRLLLVR